MSFSLFKIVTCLMVITLFACGEESNSVRDSARESLGVNNQTSAPANAQTSPATMPVSGGPVVHHYICPNNCEGSGAAAAGTCPVCGTEYVHNQAYHNQPAGTTTTTSSGTQKVTFPGGTVGGETNPATPATPPAPEPAQNTAGVWHYTCPNGCEGGAGSAGTCAKCGTALAHNSAYHQ